MISPSRECGGSRRRTAAPWARTPRRGSRRSGPRKRQETRMERTDWLDEGLSPADARFLMLTAITHHTFSSPAWGEHEVRKLHAELAELDQLVTQAVALGSARITRTK